MNNSVTDCYGLPFGYKAIPAFRTELQIYLLDLFKVTKETLLDKTYDTVLLLKF